VTLIEPITIWGRKKELTCVTGTIEPNEPHFEAAKRELEEETGIKVLVASAWVYVGGFNFNKSATSKRHLYLVNVSENATVNPKKTDGSTFEKNTIPQLLPIAGVDLSTDIYLHFLTLTLLTKIHGKTESPESNSIRKE
jgi:8-oxo-dGTP pyrophosphatase MutT (NUDIX family)